MNLDLNVIISDILIILQNVRNRADRAIYLQFETYFRHPEGHKLFRILLTLPVL